MSIFAMSPFPPLPLSAVSGTIAPRSRLDSDTRNGEFNYEIPMRHPRSTVLVLFLPFLLAVAFADDGPKKANIREKLVGTWKLVSARYGGEEFTFPEGVTVVKHVTPAQFMTVIYDKDGKVLRAAGGAASSRGKISTRRHPSTARARTSRRSKARSRCSVAWSTGISGVTRAS